MTRRPASAAPLARLLVMLLLTAAALAAASPAGAQVRRCTTPDGATIFTDRACNEVGGTDKLVRGDAPGAPAWRYRGGCARSVQDLVFQMTAAIDARDGNRLANVYHWPGTGYTGGYAVAARLDAIAQRPLVDITALRPAERVVVQETPAGTSALLDPDYFPQVAASRAPVAIRVDQTLGNGITPSRTVFRLRKHFSCWWISF